jgi:hypothetical protein
MDYQQPIGYHVIKIHFRQKFFFQQNVLSRCFFKLYIYLKQLLEPVCLTRVKCDTGKHT